MESKIEPNNINSSENKENEDYEGKWKGIPLNIIVISLIFIGTILLLLLDFISKAIFGENVFFVRVVEYVAVIATITGVGIALNQISKLKNINKEKEKAREDAEMRNIYYNSLEYSTYLILEMNTLEDYIESINYDSAKSVLPSIKRHFLRIISTINSNLSVKSLFKNKVTYSSTTRYIDYEIKNKEFKKLKYSKITNLEDEDKYDFKKEAKFLENYQIILPKLIQFLSDLNIVLMDILKDRNIERVKQGKVEVDFLRHIKNEELLIVTNNIQCISSFVTEFKTTIKTRLD